MRSFVMHDVDAACTRAVPDERLSMPFGLVWRRLIGKQSAPRALLKWEDRLVCVDWAEARVGLYGLDSETGRLDWHIQTDVPGYGTTGCIVGGRVLVYGGGSVRSGAAAYDVADGRRVWHRPELSAEALTNPLVLGETIVLGVVEGAGARETQRVCALEAGTGETVWQFRAPAPLAAVAVAQDRLVLIEGRVAESEGEQFPSRVFCVSPGSGREEWVADIREAARWWNVVEKCWKPGSVASSVAVHAGRVVLPADAGQMVCLDLRDGRLRWTYRFEGGYPTEPVLVGDRVYFMYLDRYFCLDAETGQEVLLQRSTPSCRLSRGC